MPATACKIYIFKNIFLMPIHKKNSPFVFGIKKIHFAQNINVRFPPWVIIAFTDDHLDWPFNQKVV